MFAGAAGAKPTRIAQMSCTKQAQEQCARQRQDCFKTWDCAQNPSSCNMHCCMVWTSCLSNHFCDTSIIGCHN